MTKVDFKKTLKHLYASSKKEFSVVDVPAMSFLMVDGQGNPNTEQSYQDAVEALYAVAYKLKFLSKKNLEKDYVVPPLEGLWWADDMDSFTARAKEKWHWTMMIMQPEWISQTMFEEALEQAQAKKDLPSLALLRLESYKEGQSVQIMHVGSYDDEAPVLARLHKEWMPEHNYTFNGKHHEVYLSDPRKVAAEKLKTILRQPVCPTNEAN